jgi:predicted amidophosphoribosyltransferase
MPKKYDFLDRCIPCKNRYGKADPIVRTRAVSRYLYLKEFPDDIFSQNIREFKSNPGLVEILGECMWYTLKNRLHELLKSDVIVPVPTSNLKERGYNQAELLARYISKESKIPLEDILFTTMDCASVHSQETPAGKAEAISGNMGCKKKYSGEVALLIDDTYQEGQTKTECARVLLDHGISKVWCLVLGRAVSKKHIEYLKKTDNET